MNRSRIAGSLASVLVLLLSVSLGGPANAQPDDGGPPPPAAAVTLGWPALGLEPEVFLGPNSATSYTVPLPTGLAASRLRGTITAPLNISAGYLEVNDVDGRLLGTVNLPPAGAAAAATPIDVDISAARVQKSSVELTLTVRPLDVAGSQINQYGIQYCGPLQLVTLRDLAVEFTGTEPPVTTIAGFFPPVLERVTVYAPADADAAEQQAVLMLVSTLVRLYLPQPLAVAVVNQPRGAAPPPAAPLGRAVVVERGGAAGLRVENSGAAAAYLRVSGGGDELSTQVSLLVNELQSLAQAPASRVDQAGSEKDRAADSWTFGQLNINGKTDVLRTNNLRVGIGRAALGNGRVDSVQVHLMADYTPVPEQDAAAVVIRSGGDVVYRAALNDTGRLDAAFDLPNRLLGQYVSIDLALTYTPHQVCNPLIAPITFQLDPQSTLTVRRGGPPLGGFTAMPSEFSPSFEVAFDGSSPDQLIYAARVVAAVSSLTSAQLTPKVVDLKTAADGRAGALIIAKSSALRQTSLHPPLSGDGTTLNVELPTELRVDIDGGLGSIQVFADRPRDRTVVLVTTSGEWNLIDPLFGYVDGLEGKWSALSGDVLAAGKAGVPTNLSIFSQRDVDDRAASSESSMRGWLQAPWVVIGIGVAVIAVLALAAAILLLSRRRRRRPNAGTVAGAVPAPKPVD
ncbi:hypothetical protein AU197_25410 [Mycobacterium sp. IS-1590]|uniref:hypothetical protein n=1 Tax=Mycobacterium sp. IS-1590 TaxID=1772286 RepID=UPI00074A554E|nr:hypothetical protein [Mycobacterium sp. IS-1590]KUI43267.1 hypothetical protein AU197_25410 [Mycobacterium sp. IS-1590]